MQWPSTTQGIAETGESNSLLAWGKNVKKGRAPGITEQGAEETGNSNELLELTAARNNQDKHCWVNRASNMMEAWPWSWPVTCRLKYMHVKTWTVSEGHAEGQPCKVPNAFNRSQPVAQIPSKLEDARERDVEGGEGNMYIHESASTMCVVVAREWEQGEIKQGGQPMPWATLKAFLEVCTSIAIHRRSSGLAPWSGWDKVGINFHAVWTVLSLNKQHNQMIDWDNILLKAAGDRWLSPFPCALKQADKAVVLWCANTRTQTHPCLLSSLPRACASQPVRQCCSAASLESHPYSSSWPRFTRSPRSSQGDTQTCPFPSGLLRQPSAAETKTHWNLDLAVWMASHNNPQTRQVPSQLLLLRGSTDRCVSKPLGSLPHFNTNSLFGLGFVN